MILISLASLFGLPLLDSTGRELVLAPILALGHWAALVIGVVFFAGYAHRVTAELQATSNALFATQMALAREQRLQHLGGVVAAAAHEMGTPLATIKLIAAEPDIMFVRDLFELRAIVEPAAAALAAERRDRADLKIMKDALTAMRRHTLATEAGRAADRDFHDAILHATRNDALVALAASIGAAVSWTTKFKQRARALPRNPIPDHARVFKAIAALDGAAAGEAMRALVDLALEDTRSSMEGGS